MTAATPPRSATWLEINATHLQHNIRILRRALEPARLCMVTKANAYGHGYNPIIPLAEEVGQRDFAVFSAREAYHALAASDGKSRFQIMGGGDPANLPWIISNKIALWLNTRRDVETVGLAAAQHGRLDVHLELDTGMHRSGIDMADALDAAVAVHDHPDLHLAGVGTHLSGAEDAANAARIDEQLATYHAFLAQLKEAGISPGTRHVASSAAGLLHESCRLDMVRAGIACYGLWPSRHVEATYQARGQSLDLRRVLGWKSRITALRDVRDGEFVGYGSRYEAEGDTRVALVAVGYGDGLSREITNNGFVLVRGRRAGIVGAVNMSMVQVHVGHIEDVQVGDEVVLVGWQGGRAITIAGFTEYNNVVNYEMMARLSWEVPRVVVREDLGPSP